MARVFRRQWFPRHKLVGFAPQSASISLSGVQATAASGSLNTTVSFNQLLTGLTVTAQLTAPSITVSANQSLTGVAATATVGSLVAGPAFSLVGQAATTGFGVITRQINLIGQSVTASVFTGTFAVPSYSLDLIGNFVTAEVGTINNSGVPADRMFIIAGIEQVPIAPGIVLLPTSESIAYGPTAPYIVGSSQFYTIGEVHWNGIQKTQGVDWQFVSPFNHIIEILDTVGILTDIQLIYYRWDIGVRAGFKVNAYPVSFGFTGTTIIAERVPAPDEFFTVEYTSTRPGDNPRTMFAIFPNMVDDFLADHTLYDDASGFQTFRPAGWKIFDTLDDNVWEWDGSNWTALGLYPNGTLFYVKRSRKVYEYTTLGGVNLQYTAGDGAAPLIEEVIDYPLFGESIGKNFLADAFSTSAASLYPSAYEISLRAGDYDTWVPDIDS